MIFLVHYDRSAGRLVELRQYADELKIRASKERLELEIDLLRNGVIREVVLLEANSIDALQKTHNRYFKGVSDIARSVKTVVRLNDGLE